MEHLEIREEISTELMVELHESIRFKESTEERLVRHSFLISSTSIFV
ncbi:MAG: hypothetical protein RBR63_04185 [Methanosarcina vacuolata]|nr:hypothetical protein [Methanosarcina vacuolata]